MVWSRVHDCPDAVVCRRPDQLWRAVPRRRTDLVMPGRSYGECYDQQALRQTPADTVDEARRAPAVADPNTGARWHAPASLRERYPGLANDNSAETAQTEA